MRFKYQTSYATFLQFVVVVLLSLLNDLINIISTCHSKSDQCISNTIPSVILFILTAGWFAIIMLMGYYVQLKRDRKLTVVLIGAELVILAVAAYINFPHEKGLTNKFTSLVDAGFAIWVIYLSINIFLANKKRIVKPLPIRKPKRR